MTIITFDQWCIDNPAHIGETRNEYAARAWLSVTKLIARRAEQIAVGSGLLSPDVTLKLESAPDKAHRNHAFQSFLKGDRSELLTRTTSLSANQFIKRPPSGAATLHAFAENPEGATMARPSPSKSIRQHGDQPAKGSTATAGQAAQGALQQPVGFAAVDAEKNRHSSGYINPFSKGTEAADQFDDLLTSLRNLEEAIGVLQVKTEHVRAPYEPEGTTACESPVRAAPSTQVSEELRSAAWRIGHFNSTLNSIIGQLQI